MSENRLIKRKPKDFLLFSEALEYFNRFDKRDFIFDQEIEHLNPNQLRDEMLNELNNLKSIISNHPDLKFNKLTDEEKECFTEFIKFYSICPICGSFLHYNNMRKLFFDEEKQDLIKYLTEIMKMRNKKLNKYDLNIGIPCCACYKEIFEEEKSTT